MGKIQFKNVNKIYPNGFHAIHDFNLTIDEGEFIVFVGPSGCGKSTVLRMLGGLEQISSGEVILDGKVVNKCPPVERDIAIVFQDYALYSNMSVYENVGISMKVQHEKDTVILDKVLEAADTVEITEYLNRLPKQLSGGQKQRVALARAIVRKPKAFLMDEPLSNLDAKLRNSTRIEIVRLQQRLGILQRRRRGFRRCLVCIRPRKNAIGCGIFAVPELVFAQQDMQRQNVDIVLCRQLL